MRSLVISLLVISLSLLTVVANLDATAQTSSDESGADSESLVASRVRRHLEAGHRFYQQGNDRGVNYKSCVEYELALSELSEAIILNPRHPEAYNSRGNVYRNSGFFELALADYDRAIGLDSRQADFFNNRGLTLGLVAEHQKAIADYTVAIELDAAFFKAYNNRGIS